MADGEFHSKITIYVRSATGEKSVEIKEDATVKELKYEIAKQFGTPVEQVHLIFAGKFLNGHEKIKQRDIKDHRTIFLVIKNKNNRLQEASNFSSRNHANLPRRNSSGFDSISTLVDLSQLPNISDPAALSDLRQRIERGFTNNSERMRQLLTNPVHDLITNPEALRDENFPEFPAIQNILQELRENPQFLSNVDASFLQIMMHFLRKINSNPEIPKRLRDSLNYFESNPEHMQQMQNIIQKITSHLQGTETEEFYRSPAFKEAMLRILRGIAQIPTVTSLSSTTDTTTTTTSESAGASPPQPVTTSSGFTISSATEKFCELMIAIAFSVEQLEDRYTSEMEQLANMGFGDRETNLEALISVSGNIPAAVQWLTQPTDDHVDADYEADYDSDDDYYNEDWEY